MGRVLACAGLAMWVAVCGHAAAQPRRWADLAAVVFQNYGPEQGLPPVLPTALAQDRNGFLWIGTQSGLVRWDGYRFTAYDAAGPNGRRGLPAGWIRALHVDAEGRLWVGSDTGGLAAYDQASDTFVPQGIETNGITGRHIGAMSGDGQGGLWIGTDQGLYHRPPGQTPGAVLRREPNGPLSLADDAVECLLLDKDGTLWVGGSKGLLRLERGARTFTRVPLVGTAASDTVTVSALFQSEDGRLWVGTTQQGLFLVDPGRAEATPFVARAPSDWTPRDGRISGIAAAGPGEIWVALRAAGIVAITLADHQVRRIRHDQLVPDSLAHDDVWTILQDTAGAVWVGNGGGLSYHPADIGTVSTVFGDTRRANGVTSPDVSAVLSARDGRVWLGFLSGGVDVVDPSAGRVASLRPNSSRQDLALPQDVVTAMAEAADGSVFIGTVRGLYRADHGARRTTLVRLGARPPHEFVRTLLVDGATLWIGGPDGLWRAPADAGAPSDGHPAAVARLSTQNVFALQRSGPDDLWIGTTDRLQRLDLQTMKMENVLADPGRPAALPAPLISSLLVDRQGRLWVGTFGGGLAVMSGRDSSGRPQFRRIGAAQGLPNLNVDKLLLDGAGLLWASTDNGLAVVDPATLRVRPVGRAAGAVFSIYWANSGATDLWGEPMFGAKGGLTIVRPGWPPSWTRAAPVVISDIRIGGQPVAGGRFNGSGPATPLEIRPDRNSLAVEFAALDFTVPERNRYAYRLLGFDPEWIETDSTRRIAAYTNLPPGRYVLELRGSNRDGLWTQPPLKIPIHVLPAWYQTLGFILLLAIVAAAAGVALVTVIVRRRTESLRRRQVELEHHIALRTAELQTANERLSALAKTDPLTGCATRRHFMERAQDLIELGHRGLPISLAIIDLDNFKSINDRYGHPVGDEVLSLAAGALREQIRASDLIGRIGGEEFAVLMPNTRADEALTVVDRLRDALATAEFKIAEAQIRTTASVGLAEQLHTEDFASLYARADAALYAAKARGRNRVVAAADIAPAAVNSGH